MGTKNAIPNIIGIAFFKHYIFNSYLYIDLTKNHNFWGIPTRFQKIFYAGNNKCEHSRARAYTRSFHFIRVTHGQVHVRANGSRNAAGGMSVRRRRYIGEVSSNPEQPSNNIVSISLASERPAPSLKCAEQQRRVYTRRHGAFVRPRTKT